MPGRSDTSRIHARWRIALAAAAIVGAAGVAYHNSFSGAFVLDDESSITENPTIRALWPPGPVFSPPSYAGVGGRPFANLTFALNFALSGHAAWSYHAVNLLMHALAGLALFGVLRRTLESPPLQSRFGASALALATAVAALWIVHPVQTAAVDYVSQRTEGLMGLCYLLTLYGFIRSVGGNSRAWQIVSVVACILGMASKEVMVTAPAMVLLYDRTFVAGTFGRAWRERGRFYLALASTWLLLAGLMLASHATDRGVGFARGISWFDYGLTEIRAIAQYLQVALWPTPLVFDYGWDFAPDPIALGIGLMVTGTLLGATLWALWRRPRIGFAGAWFFGILAPTSSIVPVISQPIAESRMYLSLVPLIALAVLGVYALERRRVFLLATLAGLGLALVTVDRNTVYRSALMLWSITSSQRPANARAHSNLASILIEAGRPTEAIEQARTALNLRPNYPEAHTNLGAALAGVGRTSEAIEHYRAALQLDPEYAYAHANLGAALLESGSTTEALAHFESALLKRPDLPKVQNNYGVALLQAGRVAEAIAHDEMALRLDPDLAEAHYNLGNALAQAGRREEAVAQFEAALRLEPDLAKAENNLGVVLLRLGRAADAIVHFKAALRIRPDYPEARRNLAAVHAEP